MARASYRVGQFFRALFPRVSVAGLRRAGEVLGESELRLFLGMENRDQHHGLRVLEDLESRGVTEADLLAAALLHDCGKGKVPVWLRVGYVLWPGYVEALASSDIDAGEGRRFHPRLARLTKMAAGAESGAAAYRLVNHARLGAELAQQAGASAATVRYISGMADGDERAKIALLRAADEAN